VCNKCKENRRLERICKIYSVEVLDIDSTRRPAIDATVKVKLSMMLQTRRKSLHVRVYYGDNIRRILSKFIFDFFISESELVSALTLKHYLKLILLYIAFRISLNQLLQ